MKSCREGLEEKLEIDSGIAVKHSALDDIISSRYASMKFSSCFAKFLYHGNVNHATQDLLK
jgi:hypothetical protein